MKILLLVESTGGITLRASHLNPCVRLSPHTASDLIEFPFAHVDIIVAAFMNGH